jgi:hypothetical protein
MAQGSRKNTEICRNVDETWSNFYQEYSLKVSYKKRNKPERKKKCALEKEYPPREKENQEYTELQCTWIQNGYLKKEMHLGY